MLHKPDEETVVYILHNLFLLTCNSALARKSSWQVKKKWQGNRAVPVFADLNRLKKIGHVFLGFFQKNCKIKTLEDSI
jgi:hypothetical protein